MGDAYRKTVSMPKFELNPHYDNLRADLTELGTKWQNIMDLGHFTINHVFRETVKEDEPDTLADTKAFWQYRQARIAWYLPTLSQFGKPEVENAMVHELAHVLLNPIAENMKANKDDLMELSTENVTRALILALAYRENNV